MPQRKDYTGKQFGRLTVLGDAPDRGKHRRVYVKCSCGNQKEVFLTVLNSGDAVSCGCYKKEVTTLHGAVDTPLYRVWTNMRSRCNDPNAKYYPDYGGRGIKVWAAWDDFLNFQRWAELSGYRQGLTLDRKNNDKGYYPENCHWVDRTHQQRNRRGQKGSSSKYTGVSWCNRTGKWKVGIKVNRKSQHLGCFSDEIEAARARDHYIKTNQLTGFRLNGV